MYDKRNAFLAVYYLNRSVVPITALMEGWEVWGGRRERGEGEGLKSQLSNRISFSPFLRDLSKFFRS